MGSAALRARPGRGNAAGRAVSVKDKRWQQGASTQELQTGGAALKGPLKPCGLILHPLVSRLCVTSVECRDQTELAGGTAAPVPRRGWVGSSLPPSGRGADGSLPHGHSPPVRCWLGAPLPSVTDALGLTSRGCFPSHALSPRSSSGGTAAAGAAPCGDPARLPRSLRASPEHVQPSESSDACPSPGCGRAGQSAGAEPGHRGEEREGRAGGRSGEAGTGWDTYSAEPTRRPGRG